ncbi:MAG: hypothetical protein ABI609_06040 [Acidobacteriota bacterium]
MPTDSSAERRLLRHTLATLAYRASKVLRQTPPDFGAFRAAPGSRAAGEILAHLGDLFDWALTMTRGEPVYREQAATTWAEDSARFFACLQELDALLTEDQALTCSAEGLFQGPIADALTHVGQLAFMRRLAGEPVRGESYFRADIATGRVGAEQAAPRFEFD